NIFIFAGSKGREYKNTDGIRGCFPVEEKKQQKLNIMNNKLSDLIKKPEYEIFSLIGSGLQFKFGQTTIARQDIYNSISKEESEDFLKTVTAMVKETDPEGQYFRIQDTGKDIEIVLTIESVSTAGILKDFDKGDGVRYLDRTLGLGLKSGPNLICGDTLSDVPMVFYSAEKTKSTFTIFVTEDRDLREKLLSVCGNSFFVPSPDTLVTILNLLGKRGSL
ncbi:MAG: trehalose 6-phosphate synthase, partial [Spirochaetes bacterium]|nr:trehalose 6-phosphate synthase [Spirochaetota bacterium]